MRGIIAFVVFTVIGLLNEIYQNTINGRALFESIAESAKDIKINLLGGFVFLITIAIRVRLIYNTKLLETFKHSGWLTFINKL